MNNPESIEIIKRFYEAVKTLKNTNRIRGIQSFTREHGINRWNFNTVSKNPESDMFQVVWISYLVNSYDISAQWIMTGKGNMFVQSQKDSIIQKEILEKAKQLYIEKKAKEEKLNIIELNELPHKYPHLTPLCENDKYIVKKHNLLSELKEHFPKHQFKIKQNKDESINIFTEKNVNESKLVNITDRFKNSNSNFNKIFGGFKNITIELQE